MKRRRLKELKRIYAKKEILLNDKNQAVIKVFVHDLESVISPFSLQDNIVINSEFANFLDQHILATHLIHDINIQIKSNHLEKQEDIVLIQEAIKNYYYEEAIISYRKIRKTIIQSIIFTFLAVIIFSLVIPSKAYIRILCILVWVYLLHFTILTKSTTLLQEFAAFFIAFSNPSDTSAS